MPPRKPYCSTRMVFAPARADPSAAIRPEGPPPATTTSDSLCTLMSMFDVSLLTCVVGGCRGVERLLGVGSLHEDRLDRLRDFLGQLVEIAGRAAKAAVLA